MEGTVKWFNRTKRYGFIQGEDGEEYFVHSSGLSEGTFIRDNDKVSFEPAEGERGKQAKNVTLLQKGSEIEQGAAEETTPEETSEETTPEETSEETTLEDAAEEKPKEKKPKKKAKKTKKK